MKITSETISVKTFKPFKLIIEVNTENEAKMLMALTNNESGLREFLNNSNFNKNGEAYSNIEVNSLCKIWHNVNNLIGHI